MIVQIPDGLEIEIEKIEGTSRREIKTKFWTQRPKEFDNRDRYSSSLNIMKAYMGLFGKQKLEKEPEHASDLQDRHAYCEIYSDLRRVNRGQEIDKIIETAKKLQGESIEERLVVATALLNLVNYNTSDIVLNGPAQVNFIKFGQKSSIVTGKSMQSGWFYYACILIGDSYHKRW